MSKRTTTTPRRSGRARQASPSANQQHNPAQKPDPKSMAQVILDGSSADVVWTELLPKKGKQLLREVDVQEVVRRIVVNVPVKDRPSVLERYIDWVSCDRRLVDPERPLGSIAWDRIDDILDRSGLISKTPGNILVLRIPVKGGVSA